jgi:hypothetical protein
MPDPRALTHPFYLSQASHYGIADQAAAVTAAHTVMDSLDRPTGVFLGDNLLTWAKSLGFLDDMPFRRAWQQASETPHERGAIWRRVVLVWAARSALRLEGDFVECGCYKGTGPRIVADTIGFGALDRRYYLYDLFDHDATMPHHSMTEHGAHLADQVRARFADLPNVVVTQGRVPDSFAIAAPEKIAMMHLDLNNREAEIAALEALWDRMTPGAILVLDDFGWIYYRDQLKAETNWFAARGYHVLELPTGQGLVIK